MLPEWGRFVTAVKLNRGLRDSNYDQFYAYLKQHEVYANENKMMLDRFAQHTVDPLDMMSNVSNQQHYPQSSITSPSTYVQPHLTDTTQLDSGLSPTDNLIENLTNTLAFLIQSYKTYLPQTNNQLRTSSHLRNHATIQDDKVVIQNVQGRQDRGQGNNIRGASAAGYGGDQNRVGYANPGQARQIKYYNCNGIGHIVRNFTQPKRPHNSEYFKDKMLLMQDQENGMTLDEEQLLFITGGQDNIVDDDLDEQPIQDLALNVDNVFQADDCDAFDSDVDEAPTAQTMFMANLSSAYLVYDEAGPSYDSDVLFKVYDHDHYQDAVCEHHEVHEMNDDVQPNYVVYSYIGYTSDSNMITYDQYVKDNAVQAVQSDVSAIPNDAYMMILNDMHEPPAQHVYVTTQIKVVDKSLTAKLATYKEQVELYKRRARFELTEKEQKIDEQLRIVITGRNIKEENLKKELHSVKMQLASTINHNKSMVEEVTSLKKDFKQKENQYLEEFLDLKALKEKVNKKCDEIERKSFLIANDTLIANCLSKEVFYIATNSELNVSRFSAMHEVHTVVQARCLELETELSKFKNRIQKDDHDVMVKRFSNLEVQYLNLRLKYQHLKENLGNNNSLPDQLAKVLAPGMYAIDVEPISLRLRNNKEVYLDYLKHLKESVATLREIVEDAKVERPLDRSVASACLYTKHSQELLEYVIGTCSKDFNKRDKKQTTTPLNRKKQVTFVDQYETSNTNTQKHAEQQITQKINVSVLPCTGVDSCTDASGSKPKSNTKKNKISPAKSVNKKTLKDHSRTNKSHLQKPNRVDSSISSKRTVINLNSDYVCKTCNKCFILANHDIALYYPTNDNEDLGKLKPMADIGIFVSYAPSKKGYRIYNKRTRRIMETIHVQFDELSEPMAHVQLSTGPAPTFFTPGQIKPPRVDRAISPAPIVPVPVNSAGTPSSTAIDQDAPSPSHSPSSLALQSQCYHQGVAAKTTLMDENPFALVDKDPFINIFASEPTSAASSFGDASLSNSTYVTQTLHHLGK
nr:retrovirus-related Pol polyprotein from transposon TNT 1-94 [Tanacetum cinerariifolium]